MGERDGAMYTLAVLEVNPFALGKKRKDQEKMIAVIKTLDGLVGVHPVIDRETLLLFMEKNKAEMARNVLNDAGCPVGDFFFECYVPKEVLQE